MQWCKLSVLQTGSKEKKTEKRDKEVPAQIQSNSYGVTLWLMF